MFVSIRAAVAFVGKAGFERSRKFITALFGAGIDAFD